MTCSEAKPEAPSPGRVFVHVCYVTTIPAFASQRPLRRVQARANLGARRLRRRRLQRGAVNVGTGSGGHQRGGPHHAAAVREGRPDAQLGGILARLPGTRKARAKSARRVTASATISRRPTNPGTHQRGRRLCLRLGSRHGGCELRRGGGGGVGVGLEGGDQRVRPRADGALLSHPRRSVPAHAPGPHGIQALQHGGAARRPLGHNLRAAVGKLCRAPRVRP